MHCKWYWRLGSTNAFAQIAAKSQYLCYDFNSYIIVARTSGVIKFDPMLVVNFGKNNPAEWEFLNGLINRKQVLFYVFGI